MAIAATALRIEHRSDVAEARRRATELAAASGVADVGVGRVALVVTELATNLLKHAGRGWFYASPAFGARGAVDVLVSDAGRGIADVQQALDDGYSTAGTPGTGIGAVRRQSQRFDVFSQPDRGTVVTARVGPDPLRSDCDEGALQVSGFSAPSPGEEVCGDSWAVRRLSAGTGILVADGLGHGPDAAAASRAAVEVFLASRASSPAAMIEEIHERLGATRGAAVAVAWIEPANEGIRFAGIGNVSASVVTGGNGKGMVSSNGTAGFVARTVREFKYEAPAGSLVVLHSDGLTSRWDLSEHPGLLRRDPGVIAGVLLRDCSRGRDDVSVVVARMPSVGGS